MSTLMSQFESFEQDYCDFTMLRHQPIFTVCLSSSYFANGRFVSPNEVEVWILDESEVAENIRTGALISFEIDLLGGSCLQGTASVKLGASRIGPNEKRFIEAILCLEEANEKEITASISQWLT